MPARCGGSGMSVKFGRLERVTGIEPAQPAWKAGTLPLSYTRDGREPNGRAGAAQSRKSPISLGPSLMALWTTIRELSGDLSRLSRASSRGCMVATVAFRRQGRPNDQRAGRSRFSLVPLTLSEPGLCQMRRAIMRLKYAFIGRDACCGAAKLPSSTGKSASGNRALYEPRSWRQHSDG